MKKHILTTSAAFLLLTSAAVAAPGKPHSDEWIEGRIKGALDFNSYFDSTDVSIDVKKGVATLSGKVPTETERAYAESVAARFDGITSVNNQLTIDEKLAPRSRSEIGQYLDDITTTAIIKSKLAAYKITTASKVTVDTKDGDVTLQGAVASKEIKDRAGEIALSTQGVNDVDNDLKIENPQTVGEKVENSVVDATQAVSDTWISTKVRTLLTFSTDLPGSRVNVTTDKGKVILEGYARSEDQITKISDEVAEIVGVKEVDNRLTIRP